jgi:sensor histidine kinase YesM
MRRGRTPESDPLQSRPLTASLPIELVLAGGVGAGVGSMVGVMAGALEKGQVEIPLVLLGSISGLFAGLIAVLTGREVMPRLFAFPLPVRLALMIVSLVGGAFAATGVGFWLLPMYALRSARSVMLVGSINGLLALVAGALVFTYEDLVARLARTRVLLAVERVSQAEAREKAARAELQALQARINPHFFFNALNTAAAYVREDPEYAEDLLERFAGLFRFAFRRGREERVSVEEEMGFIRDYLEIERARFGERLEYDVQVDSDVLAEQVPPLILQPIVENAVLHGRDPETGQGRVQVKAARADDRGVVVEVRDWGPGPGQAEGELPRGHALENIAARVAACGGGWLEVVPADPGPGTRARIVFPARPRSRYGW